ncbi:pyridoxamine 5'-phosphate oxidase family protein [Marinactinospora thermotolerans]|uniref:Pyridoxamine 5'-phosphate oxidase n=1 Tax=Marinactinospora thermotolerans DSM 45154 TaxID=1122192 RepID=A0A1T4LTF7_9ACTN|nr:pyridoxamine 5'-phosphate oxidase family protein [Marinactinospora thermotolerans]SJZ57744.1 Pyridoxamine 5'-phosphate oxidase [Marinactinospora thermotolerans DSM 45154]
MTTWNDFAREAPDLAAFVRGRFEGFRHHVLATLRRDGSPRVSGTEVLFRDGHLVLGSMPGSRKALDLRRDNRYALHVNPGEPADGTMEGDAKVSGHAVEVTDDAERRRLLPEQPSGGSHLFRLLVEEVAVTTVEGDRLVIRLWRPGAGVRRFERT